MVIRGQPYAGAHGFGGELGHVAVEPRGPPCGCGCAGCLEALASAGHIALRYGVMSAGDAEACTAREVAQRAVARDAVAAALGDEAGRCGAAIGAWRASGIDEARLTSWQFEP